MNAGRPLRLLLAGFGNVGQTLAEILVTRNAYPALADLELEVVAITTGSRGTVADERGIDLAAALEAIRSGGRFSEDHPGRVEVDTLQAASMLDYDVLVELTPLTIAARGEPAIGHLAAALGRGRHAITCNKGPIAWAYRKLDALARRNGCTLLHEGTVMDGAPVFNLARHCLRGNRVVRLEGILNSTTNVVLGEMERGAALSDAVAQAQRLGIAEADPANDLDGWDAAVKIAALANVLMGAQLLPDAVQRTSIRDVTPDRLEAALAHGHRLKVVCEATREADAVRGSVTLREVPAGDVMATVEGTGSALRIVTDLMGTIVLVEEEPDVRTTAYAVISDLFELAGKV